MESIAETRERPIWQEPRAIALLLAASLTTMANATISPALPGIERLFADDPNAALLTRLLVPAPSLSVALFAPLAGMAADRLGRRVMLLVGVMLFVVAGGVVTSVGGVSCTGCDFSIDFGYRYAGKNLDLTAKLNEILERLPSLQQLVVVPYSNPTAGAGDFRSAARVSHCADANRHAQHPGQQETSLRQE